MRRTPWPDVTHPDDLELDLVPFRRMARGELDSYSVEKRFLHRDGSHVWARLTLSLVRDAAGAPDYEIAIIEAIGDRKRAEAALREGEARFRDLADHIAQLAWMADEHGRPFWHNRRFLDYTGATADELRAAGLTSRCHPDHVARVADGLARCIAAGEPWEDTFPLRGRHGEDRWFLSRAIPIRDEGGAVRRWFGTSTHVTELRRAQADLEAEGRRKSESLAVLSHELRNPLTPVRNSVWILGKAAPGGEPARRAIAVIERQVAHMVRLVDDLLDVTRIARGKVRLRLEPFALDELVRAAADDLRAPFRHEGVELDVELPDGPVLVLADRTRIAQVVSNLVQNALKFTPAGGRVRVSLERSPRGDAVIRVRDTGVGIEPRLLARLFEPFVQGDETLDRSKGGLGLGLALAKGLFELHGGGRVAAHSDGPGAGTEVTMTLPLEAGRGRDAA
jgi:PAS domain S-box-containing protein